MAKNLVIVESPAKAKTLSKYLGRDYTVKASVGHVVDLPKSKLGVDIENDFAPEYTIIHGKTKVISDLKKAAKGKENIYLAPDPDREGEAIAWHIAQKLDGKKSKIQRVLFNEITKKAVQEAIKHPIEIDQHRFEAQQTRRILDRLVGYQISPILWDKVRRGLSAGRVQSVAVRIVCDREREIRAFQKKEYWSITAQLEGENPPAFTARLLRIGGDRLDPEKFRIENEASASEIVEKLRGQDFKVTKVDRKERRRFPTPPFITSRLQQEASRKLGYTPSRTMRIAQRLYEGIELGADGPVGLITYMRTDSVRVSPEAVDSVRGLIGEKYGKEYLPKDPPTYKTKKGAQDAHEAIRPTALDRPPDTVQGYLSKEELAVYTLIWNRFVASQMTPAVFDQTAIDIQAGDMLFRATGQIMKFDGFIRVYMEGVDDEKAADDDKDRTLPSLSEDEILRLLEITPEQHFTQPPPRYSQATLIKDLEENGIGRPSTYASIMSTIISKEYVGEENKRLHATELGFLVTDLLIESFPNLMDAEFTAGMENTLDEIEEGKQPWLEALRSFYGPFSKDLIKAGTEMRDVKREGQPTDVECPKCKSHMVVKWGRAGEFLGCSAYPECNSTTNFKRDEGGKIVPVAEEVVDEVCEKCGSPMKMRFGRYGKFLGCSAYPECKNVRSLNRPEPTGVKCPDCKEGEIMEKKSRGGKIFFSCGRYPECRFATWERPVPEPCPLCEAPFVVEKTTKRYGTVRRCLSEGCEHKETVEEAEAV